MRTNTTKAKLKAGEMVLGSYIRHADAGLTEAICHYGWDYLFFDCEHSSITPRDCEHLARACELRGVTPIVRVPVNQPATFGRYLDTGMQGIQIPMVNTAAEAEAVVRAVKYQPLGSRGLAAGRAADYGQAQPFSLRDYTAAANAETLVVVQIETAAAVEQAGQIANVPEVDVVFIGPTDLSHSLGVPGDLQNEKVQRAFDSVAAAVLPSGKALGILVPNAEAARQWRARGARYIMVVLEALLAPAARGFLQAARS